MIDFELGEEAGHVIALAEDLAARSLRPSAREAEAHGVSAQVREDFAQTGLAQLAEDAPDVAELAPVTRFRVLQALAHGDAGATLALWMPPLAARIADGLGAGPAGFVHAADTVGPVAWLPLGGAETVLTLLPDGWALVRVAAEPIRALGLRAAGAARVTEVDILARDTADPGPALAELRLTAAAMLTGIGTAALHHAERYVQERVAFGRTLSDHQGVAFLVAEVAMAVTGAGLLVDRAALSLAEDPRLATDAYLESVEAALLATSHAVQLLGGHGFMKDHPVEMWMRDARALSLLWGGVDAARRDAWT